MKKFFTAIFAFMILSLPIFAKTDRASEEYLKTARHVSAMNPFAEVIVEHAIKKAIKKEAKGKYKVKFRGYTLSSMKKGIFKYLEITGKNVDADGIYVPYFNLKTVTDYNWIDYNQNPIVFKSDITFDTTTYLSERTINEALETEDYKKVLRRLNKLAYPLFTLNSVKVEINEDKMNINMKYNFPINPKPKDKTLVISSKFKVENGKIRAYNVTFNRSYGNLPINKIINLINLVNPLEFAIDLIDDKKCKAVVETLNIEDDIVKINGKIYIKGES